MGGTETLFLKYWVYVTAQKIISRHVMFDLNVILINTFYEFSIYNSCTVNCLHKWCSRSNFPEYIFPQCIFHENDKTVLSA